MDDVWDEKVISCLDCMVKGSKLLITSRLRFPTTLVSNTVCLDMMTSNQSSALLLMNAGLELDKIKDEEKEFFWRVLKKCGNLAIAITITGRMRKHIVSTWREILLLFDQHELKEFRESNDLPSLYDWLDLSVQMLDKEERQRYHMLAVFPHDIAISTEVLRFFWLIKAIMEKGGTHTMADCLSDRYFVDKYNRDSNRFLLKMVRHSLVTSRLKTDDCDYVFLHDLQLDYLKTLCKDRIRYLNQVVLRAFWEKCMEMGYVNKMCLRASAKVYGKKGEFDLYVRRYVAYHVHHAYATPRAVLEMPTWDRDCQILSTEEGTKKKVVRGVPVLHLCAILGMENEFGRLLRQSPEFVDLESTSCRTEDWKRITKGDLTYTHNWTALHFASCLGHLAVVQKLLEYNANVDLNGCFGNLSDGGIGRIFCSIWVDGKERIFVLPKGSLKDLIINRVGLFGCLRRGLTACELAKYFGNEEIARLLKLKEQEIKKGSL